MLGLQQVCQRGRQPQLAFVGGNLACACGELLLLVIVFKGGKRTPATLT